VRIGRMIAPVRTLGPGERVCLWFQGCGKDCPGCVSPELRPTEGPEISPETLAELVIQAADRNGCTGLTISGGEPFDQPQALENLLTLLAPRFSDILVYSGYTLSQLQQKEPPVLRALDRIGVLIDGPYIQERNVPGCALRGSDNQIIHYLRPELEPVYREYLTLGRTIETFCHAGTMIRVGILNRGDAF